jgi:hypothetical protein
MKAVMMALEYRARLARSHQWLVDQDYAGQGFEGDGNAMAERCCDPRLVTKMEPVIISHEMCDLLGHAQQTFPVAQLGYRKERVPFPDALIIGESALCSPQDWLVFPMWSYPVPMFNVLCWISSECRDHLTYALWDSSRYPTVLCPAFGGECWADPNLSSEYDLMEPVRVIHSLWMLLQQRIAIKEHLALNRATRRQWSREHETAPPPSIIVVRLRRPSNPDGSESVSTPVDWSHRWMVDGHWRNQFYPSTGDHQPTWIAPFIKGPGDKPLVLKDRVYTFVR